MSANKQQTNKQNHHRWGRDYLRPSLYPELPCWHFHLLQLSLLKAIIKVIFFSSFRVHWEWVPSTRVTKYFGKFLSPSWPEFQPQSRFREEGNPYCLHSFCFTFPILFSAVEKLLIWHHLSFPPSLWPWTLCSQSYKIWFLIFKSKLLELFFSPAAGTCNSKPWF